LLARPLGGARFISGSLPHTPPGFASRGRVGGASPPHDRYTIKRFEQETHLRATLLMDVSSSMSYDGGAPETSKSAFAATLLAALGLVLLDQGDSVGAFAFDHELRKNIPPRNRADHLEALLGVLGLPPRTAAEGGHSQIEAALTDIGERIGRRGMVIVASDLLDPSPTALGPLSNLAALGHEILVFHVLHPDELEFPFKHSVRFEDPESDALLETDADAIRRGYHDELAAFLESCKQRCMASGARYTLARTDARIETVLADALVPRRRS
jgi:uncharacterized protein (DUF58 family)